MKIENIDKNFKKQKAAAGEEKVYNIPFVAKPKKYFSINGNVYYPVIVKSQEDFQKFKHTKAFCRIEYSEVTKLP